MHVKEILIISFFFFQYKIIGQDKLKTTIGQYIKEEKLAGSVWATVDSNGTIQTGAAGLINVPENKTLKPTDKVNVGSITKPILALGILKLVHEGKLSLDESVNKYLPAVKFENSWEATNPILIRHLLDHTSGLGDLRLWHFFSTKAKPNSPLSSFYESDNSVLKIYVKPGTVFSYSNMGYTLLGMIIETITEKSYESYMNDSVLRPLGMINSTFNYLSQMGIYADDKLAMGHYDGGVIAPNMPITVRPAAQFTTTAYDMGLFLKLILNKGKIDGKPFIEEKLIQLFGQPIRTNAVKNGLPNGYSCGMYMRDRYGVKGIYGLGSIIGYRAVSYTFPEQKKAFFIAYNMDSEVANYDRFNQLLIDHLAIPKKEIHKVSESNTTKFDEFEGYYIPTVTKYEPFTLVDILTSFTEIKVENGGFVLIPFQQKAKKLFYKKANIFSAEDRTEASHAFYKLGNSFYFTDSLKTGIKINGWKIFALWFSVGLGLLGITTILISGFYLLFKHKNGIVFQPIFWAFCGVLMLFLPIPFFLSQPFVEMGNKSTASLLLFFTTILLPFGVLFSIFQNFKTKNPNMMLLFGLIFILQFIFVLVYWGLIPLKLWG